MEWSDLRFVLTVAREGTLAASGRRLRVDPTTVGRRVLALEERLGVRLFDRTGEGYVLTHAGRIAVGHAEKMEVIAASLEQQVVGSDSRVEGPVRLTALDALLMPSSFQPAAADGAISRPRADAEFGSGHRRSLEARGRHRARPGNRWSRIRGRHLARAAMAIYGAEGVEFGLKPPVIGLPRERDQMPFARFIERHFPAAPSLRVPTPNGTFTFSCGPGSASASSTVLRAMPIPFCAGCARSRLTFTTSMR